MLPPGTWLHTMGTSVCCCWPPAALKDAPPSPASTLKWWLPPAWRSGGGFRAGACLVDELPGCVAATAPRTVRRSDLRDRCSFGVPCGRLK